MRAAGRSGQRARRHERGAAMAIALFFMGALVVGAASALMIGTSDIAATRNYRGSQQVHFVAESGLAHALQTINYPGVRNFQTDVDQGWNGLFGSQSRNFAPLPGFTYRVVPWTNPANPVNAGRIIATANGPEGVTNRVVATVIRADTPFAPGAIYLATDNPTDATFGGDSFTIDGTDRNYDGSAGSAPPAPGITTRNDTNTQETRDSLTPAQIDSIQGLGYSTSPPTPSVWTSPSAPSVSQMDAMIAALTAMPSCERHEVPNITGNGVYGTTSAPECHYFTGFGGLDVRGNPRGAGILIVDGNLSISGALDFKGLILVKGEFSINGLDMTTGITGSALIYGSIWTENVNLDVRGNGEVHYSSQALQLANQISGGNLPTPVQVTSIADCAHVQPGPGTGC